MEMYSSKTADTLITFHIGRGGRFHNSGHLSYGDQNKTINSYTSELFVGYENLYYIDKIIGDRGNLRNLLTMAIDGDTIAFNRLIELKLDLGQKIFVDNSGNHVGLNVDNDGRGNINIDNEYNTTYVKYLSDCTNEELIIILNSDNYKSSDVESFCKEINEINN